jgi:hypothetical protein
VRLVLAGILVAAVHAPDRVVAADGFAIDLDAGTNQDGALFRLDLDTGNRTLISDFGDPTQGPGQAPLGANPFALTATPDGLVVMVQRAGTPCATSVGCGALYVVDPATGARTPLSDFGDPAQGPTGITPFGIAVDANGDLLVADQDAGGSGRGLLIRVSMSDGTRTVVSNFGDPSQGPTGGNPSGVAIESSGDVLVADAAGFVFRIDPQTRQRTIVSDFRSTTQGPRGYAIIDVEPGPGGVLWVIDQVGEQVSGSSSVPTRPRARARS